MKKLAGILLVAIGFIPFVWIGFLMWNKATIEDVFIGLFLSFLAVGFIAALVHGINLIRGY